MTIINSLLRNIYMYCMYCIHMYCSDTAEPTDHLGDWNQSQYTLSAWRYIKCWLHVSVHKAWPWDVVSFCDAQFLISIGITHRSDNIHLKLQLRARAGCVCSAFEMLWYDSQCPNRTLVLLALVVALATKPLRSLSTCTQRNIPAVITPCSIDQPYQNCF